MLKTSNPTLRFKHRKTSLLYDSGNLSERSLRNDSSNDRFYGQKHMEIFPRIVCSDRSPETAFEVKYIRFKYRKTSLNTRFWESYCLSERNWWYNYSNDRFYGQKHLEFFVWTVWSEKNTIQTSRSIPEYVILNRFPKTRSKVLRTYFQQWKISHQ